MRATTAVASAGPGTEANSARCTSITIRADFFIASPLQLIHQKRLYLRRQLRRDAAQYAAFVLRYVRGRIAGVEQVVGKDGAPRGSLLGRQVAQPEHAMQQAIERRVVATDRAGR